MANVSSGKTCPLFNRDQCYALNTSYCNFLFCRRAGLLDCCTKLGRPCAPGLLTARFTDVRDGRIHIEAINGTMSLLFA